MRTTAAVHRRRRAAPGRAAPALAPASAIRSSSELSHRPSPFEAEVLHPQARRARHRHHRRAPVVEVLDPADLHAGRVDVDPVVGKDPVAPQHQRHDQEVAIAEALGGRPDGLGRGTASSSSHQRAQRHRRDHVFGREIGARHRASSARTRRDPAVLASRLPIDVVAEQHAGCPRCDDAIAAAFPTSGPGPAADTGIR